MREMGCQRAAEQMEQRGCSSWSSMGGWGAGTALHKDVCKGLHAWDLLLFFWSFLNEIREAHERGRERRASREQSCR